MADFYGRYNGLFGGGGGGSGGGVTSLNSETGDIILVAGSNITITPSGQNITIASTNSGGTVTSVGLSVPAASIFGVTGSPVTTSGTLGLTTTGTSGGIPYFSSTTALSSSALLTANALVLGGGAGAAPTPLGSLGTTTTVLHGNASGAPSYSAVSLTTDVSGVLPVANGGSGTATAFTQGSVIFAGASGTYSQDNAKFFWDDTNFRLGLMTATPSALLNLASTLTTGTPSNTSGAAIASAMVFEDTNTAMNGTATGMAFHSFGAPTLSALNTGVITTNAYNVYLTGGVRSITNNAITTSTALFINNGNVLGSGGAVTNSYAIQAQAGSGATNNYCLSVTGGNTGLGVIAPTARLHIGGAMTAPSWTTSGIGFRSANTTYTDSSTAVNGTVTNSGINAFQTPNIAASNTGVIYTNAATVYINAAPTAGTNVTITNPYALWIAGGNSLFAGNVTATTFIGALTGTASGNTTYTANNHGVVVSSATNAMTVIAPNASTAFPLVSGGTGADPSWAGLTVPGGGTGLTATTAYSVVCGGTTTTAALQQVSGLGTSGNVLTSNGAGALPTWQAAAGGAVPKLLGTIKITGVTWNTTSTSYATMTSSGTAAYTTTGSAISAPGSNVPGLTISSFPAGHLQFVVQGQLSSMSSTLTADDAAAYYQFSDGTNVANEESIVRLEDSSGSPWYLSVPGITQTIDYGSNQTSLTFQIKAKTIAGGNTSCIIGRNNQNLQIQVYWWPAAL